MLLIKYPAILLGMATIAQMTLAYQEGRTGFLIVDVQNCFLPGGTLAVGNGNDVIEVINGIRENYGSKFEMIITSKDWHCTNHISFASQHNNKSPFDIISVSYDSNGELCQDGQTEARSGSVSCSTIDYRLNQTLWPDHCIMNTDDARLSSALVTSSDDVVITKGSNCNIDSYSVFYDNGGFAQTELQDKLRSAGITRLIIVGLARDYCVFYTAKDAKRLGFDTYVVLDATRSVAQETGEKAVSEMQSLGVILVDSKDVGDIFDISNTGHYHSINVAVTLLSLASFVSVFRA